MFSDRSSNPAVGLYLCLYLLRASAGAPSNGNQPALVIYDVKPYCVSTLRCGYQSGVSALRCGNQSGLVFLRVRDGGDVRYVL
jgi:hypothetical protein